MRERVTSCTCCTAAHGESRLALIYAHLPSSCLHATSYACYATLISHILHHTECRATHAIPAPHDHSTTTIRICCTCWCLADATYVNPTGQLPTSCQPRSLCPAGPTHLNVVAQSRRCSRFLLPYFHWQLPSSYPAPFLLHTQLMLLPS